VPPQITLTPTLTLTLTSTLTLTLTLTLTPTPTPNPNPKALLEMVREALGPGLADEFVPLVNGGVQLHKIFGIMHDTCHTANRVARVMAELREEKARAYHGEDVWDELDPCLKVVHDFLCGNHSRNLITCGPV
jgi:hypothetical protein